MRPQTHIAVGTQTDGRVGQREQPPRQVPLAQHLGERLLMLCTVLFRKAAPLRHHFEEGKADGLANDLLALVGLRCGFRMGVNFGSGRRGGNRDGVSHGLNLSSTVSMVTKRRVAHGLCLFL